MDHVLDEALEALDGFGPEFGPGLSNHGPMAAEALVRLGRAEDVGAYVAAYRQRLEPGTPPGRPLSADEWETALGRMERWAAWVGLFDRELAESPAAEVVARWVPRLAPGTIGAATHGLIRTAHALRSLGGATARERAAAEAGASSLRRHELAQGLAYWAARYQELPGPPLLLGHLGVAGAVAGVPVLPEEAPEEHLITGRVRHLDMVAAPFEQAVAALALPDDIPMALAALAASGAVAYLANAGRGHEIALVHAVTAPMALDMVLPAVKAEDRPTLFAYAWQAVAAIHAAYAVDRSPVGPGEPGDRGKQPGPGEPFDLAVLAEAAVASGDEHAIKLVEASARAYEVTAHPALAAAAADAGRRLG